jgi:hypothetical protein
VSFAAAADPAHLDPSLDSRAVTFENPTGARGAGGRAAGGRKGSPSRSVHPGECVVLADLDGPGRITHVWLTVPPAPPEQLRALLLEVFYDGATEPSVSVPVLDFFGCPHGRPVAYDSALTAVQEGRGFNSSVPMPFGAGIRVELTNGSDRIFELYYQLDLVLGPEPASYLHVTWNRENPTTRGRDLVIASGIEGPGRFLGCSVGVRVLDEGIWYGEGEVKVFRDGDTDWPTICGTGLEDYVGTAWGMGLHAAPYGGAPLDVRPPTAALQPDFVGFYRWHLPDPIMFSTDLRVTIQQIGAATFLTGQEDEFEAFAASHPVAGRGWWRAEQVPVLHASGIVERVDDYCATAFVYAERPQPVGRVDVPDAIADVERRPYEQPGWLESFLPGVEPDVFRPRLDSAPP